MLNLVVEYAFLLMFRGWGELSSVISVATLVCYLTSPVAVMSLRKTAANLKRPLRLKGLRWIAPLAFMLASLILYWARWPLTGEVIIVMLVGLPIYLYYQRKEGWAGFGKHLKAGLWLVVYMMYMMLVSWLGSTAFGGTGVIPYGWDMVLVAVSSLVFYFWGIHSGFTTTQVEKASTHVEQPATRVQISS